MDWMILIEPLKSAGWLLLKITSYMIPLMIFLEFAKYSEWLKLFGKRVHKMLHPLGFSDGAIFPFLVGLIFGITFGGGTIIQSSKEGSLTEKDKSRLTTFLNICHALPEDTLLFVAIGANIFFILLPRLFAALLVTYLAEKWSARVKA